MRERSRSEGGGAREREWCWEKRLKGVGNRDEGALHVVRLGALRG